MPSHVFKIEQGHFGLSITDPAVSDVCDAVIADFDAFNCQITNGALNATPNVTTETIPATWCEPESTLPSVGATTYALDLGYLQDPDVVDGLSQFLFEHDTESAWFFMGMDGDNPPKAVGQLRIVAGTIGGAGRVTLTATVSLPVAGKPAICFGNATTSEGVGSPDPNNISHMWPVAASKATLAALKADAVVGDAGTGMPATPPQPKFVTATYIELVDNSKASWSGTAWVAGPSA